MKKNTLSDYLNHGEVVRWKSEPQPFPLLDVQTKKSFLMKWILAPVICIPSLIAILRANGGIRTDMMVFILAAMVAVMVTPLIQYNQLKGQKYYITNQRVITELHNGNLYSVLLDEIDGMQVMGDVAEYRCIVFGKSIFERASKSARWQACHPKTQGATDRAEGLMFYCPAKLEEALSMLQTSVSNVERKAS